MRHIKLLLQYDGAGYAGWQSQTNATAIQDLVARAVSRITEKKVPVIGASRTDAGVHALGQIASFQTESTIPCDRFLKGLNALLPEDIRVAACEEVSLAFHPIRDTKSKTYRYLLDLGEIPNPLRRHRAWWRGPRLDIGAMEKGSLFLIGEHDFKSFQGSLSDAKTTVRRITSIDFAMREFLEITFNGNGFLKYMIRNIVGTLVEIGSGKRPPEEMKRILSGKDRREAGPTAPPQGLYLVAVVY